MNIMVTPFTYINPALFPSPGQEFLSVENLAVRPRFLVASEIGETAPEFEEAQLVCGMSLI